MKDPDPVDSESLKKYSEVKLTSLHSLGLVTTDLEKGSEMLVDNSDKRVSATTTLHSVSKTKVYFVNK